MPCKTAGNKRDPTGVVVVSVLMRRGAFDRPWLGTDPLPIAREEYVCTCGRLPVTLGKSAGKSGPFMFVPDQHLISGSVNHNDHRDTGKTENRGPIIVDGGNASIVLPAPDTKRWSSRRKAAIIVGIRAGVITRKEAGERYMLSDEELAAWEAAFDQDGIAGLRITHHRGPPLVKL